MSWPPLWRLSASFLYRSWRVDVSAWWTGRGVPRKLRSGRHLASICCYHAQTSLSVIKAQKIFPVFRGIKNPIPRGTGYRVVTGGRLGGIYPATTKPVPEARVVGQVWAIRLGNTTRIDHRRIADVCSYCSWSWHPKKVLAMRNSKNRRVRRRTPQYLKTVHVSSYTRTRFGARESVCEHYRSPPWTQLAFEF